MKIRQIGQSGVWFGKYSSDGRKIVAIGGNLNDGLFIMDADGDNETPVWNGWCRWPKFVLGDEAIVFESGGGITLMTLADMSTQLVVPGNNIGGFSIFPDDKSLLVGTDTSVDQVSLTNGSSRTLFDGPCVASGDPAGEMGSISADGNVAVVPFFPFADDSREPIQIHYRHIDGDMKWVIEEATHPAWRPHSNELAFFDMSKRSARSFGLNFLATPDHFLGSVGSFRSIDYLKWSPDGRFLFVQGSLTKLYEPAQFVYDAVKNDLLEIVSLEGVSAISWHPDSSKFLTATTQGLMGVTL